MYLLQGEPGQNAMKGPFGSVDTAAKEFEKKFQDKTKNKWENRDNFVPAPGKYTLLEMDDDDDDVSWLAKLCYPWLLHNVVSE